MKRKLLTLLVFVYVYVGQASRPTSWPPKGVFAFSRIVHFPNLLVDESGRNMPIHLKETLPKSVSDSCFLAKAAINIEEILATPGASSTGASRWACQIPGNELCPGTSKVHRWSQDAKLYNGVITLVAIGSPPWLISYWIPEFIVIMMGQKIPMPSWSSIELQGVLESNKNWGIQIRRFPSYISSRKVR